MGVGKDEGGSNGQNPTRKIGKILEEHDSFPLGSWARKPERNLRVAEKKGV